MKELLVISGKGGTGKTTVLGSFAALAHNKVLADADVDAPNLHLLLSPQPAEERDYRGASLAAIDEATIPGAVRAAAHAHSCVPCRPLL